MRSERIKRVFPFLAWWPELDRHTLRADAVAALVGALVVLPQGVAYATLAGLPPQYGLYCAMVPTAVAALFGSSRHAMSGPTNAVSLMVLSALAPLAVPGSPPYISMALTLSLLCGVLMIALGALRLGALVNFISNGVILGFTSAVGLVIIVGQLPALLGIPLEHSTSFGGAAHDLLAHAADARPWALAVGVLTIASGGLARRFSPRLPAMLLATVAGTVAGVAVQRLIGPESSGVRNLGALAGAFPPLSAPDLSGKTLRALLGPALAVTILSVTQAISIVRAVAIRSGQRIDNNQELIGQGLANVAAAFFSGYPSSASVNRCALNYEAGARTPLAAVLSAVFLVALLLAFAPVVALLPLPAIAGLLVLAGWGLLDFAQMRLYLRTSRQEAAVLGTTLFATLIAPLEYAILIGVFASLVVYLSRTSRPAMHSLVPDPRHSERKFARAAEGFAECPQLKVLSIEGSIYFGAVDHVESHLDTLRDRAPGQKHLLIEARNINFVDVAGAQTLAREARKRAAAGGRLYLSNLRQPVEDALRNSGLLAEIGEENVFRSKRAAIARIYERLEPQACRDCTARIFAECAQRQEEKLSHP